MKIQDFFQKGYYINLDRRTDRKEYFEQHTKQLGLEGFFERHSGVDGFDEVDLYKPEETVTVKKGLCCSKAFHNVFKKAKEDGAERVLVCEDDIGFLPGGQELVEKALDQLQQFPNWDMIYFGGLVIGGEETVQVTENLLKANTILTLHAVGYNTKCLDKVLEYKPYEECIYDGWMGQRHYWEKYLIYPAAVIQIEGPSDIDASGYAISTNHWLSNYDSIIIKK